VLSVANKPFILGVVMLSAIMFSVITLNVAAPCQGPEYFFVMVCHLSVYKKARGGGIA
jgi:hypothetical protein